MRKTLTKEELAELNKKKKEAEKKKKEEEIFKKNVITKLNTFFKGIINEKIEKSLSYANGIGNLYEATALTDFINHLKTIGYECELMSDNNVNVFKFKASPGPINKEYAWINVTKDNKLVGFIFTDVEVNGCSFNSTNKKPYESDTHELDLLFINNKNKDVDNIEYNFPTYPKPDDIKYAIECKYRGNKPDKSILRSLIGIQTELDCAKKKPEVILYSNQDNVKEEWKSAIDRYGFEIKIFKFSNLN